MKEVILSAGGDSVVYLVPDEVANRLHEYCIAFCYEWMRKSPHAKKFRINGVYCFDEADFIDYLNQYIFPDQKSIFVKNLGWTDLGQNLPRKYRNHPNFNF